MRSEIRTFVQMVLQVIRSIVCKVSLHLLEFAAVGLNCTHHLSNAFAFTL
jgi:hypothetical protein